MFEKAATKETMDSMALLGKKFFKDTDPNMLKEDYSWLKIKEYFKEEATKIAKEI